MEPRRATEVPPWKCFNCGQWNGCCGDSTGDPGGLWCEPKELKREKE
ncbi:hypothetical protein MJA45_14195 [Paenibacillus aurantius]|uniref:Uncharacterized protein n=1 Tax=Paenibacillus aurantius TaxID=2918900 RepID=A0AA96LJF0_9BACL|nr:hypothetical protein [Paenibacillus aurantius]WNQ14118.1 hypothetical protein MJA45_14195 [Paenibacillus aurantius]